MPRPTVLVATTNPAMAYALKERLKQPCRELGLRLEVCPDGDKEQDKTEGNDLGICVYDSAEALFDALEKRDPMELADTLVVLDVGAQLKEAFEPQAPKDERWHVTDNRAGVAVELLLRFPQVFPVLLSPAVPVDVENKSPVTPSLFRHVFLIDQKNVECETTGYWDEFRSLQKELAVKHKWKEVSDKDIYKQENVDIQHLSALTIPLHFVSPSDQGKGLESTLARFAHGMRCWFDPTGLRTLVRNRFLGTLFGSKSNWGNTWGDQKTKVLRREVMLERLDHIAVAIDEEREFAMLNAYAAYKFGRRAWMVTTFAEFNNYPLWAWSRDENNSDVVVLRDIDMRFPDIPDRVTWPSDCLLESEKPRDQLKTLKSDLWRFCVKDKIVHQRLGETWRVRVVSSNKNIGSGMFGCAKQRRLGEREGGITRLSKLPGLNFLARFASVNVNDRRYFGLSKPISTLYDLKKLLSKRRFCTGTGDVVSVISKISPVIEESTGGHGAPYLNLAMAESLLLQTRRCGKGPIDNLIGALMAGEAQELLLGMSRTTALEALLLQHKHEVMAEVEFPGVSHAININSRQQDVEAILRQYTLDNRSLPMKNMFLSQFWSELKVAYHNGEQFTAAEEANACSLVHGKWMSWLSGWTTWHKYADKFFLCVKSAVIKVATSFIGWTIASTLLIVIFSLIYDSRFFPPSKENTSIFFDVLLSSITLQPMGYVDCISKYGNWEVLAVIIHLGLAYVLFGLFISMLYRKITRS